jgi:heme/copper-type cytochrome/quinol oxidase subunit 2
MRAKQWVGVIGVILLGAVILFVPLPVLAGAPAERHIRIEASTFNYAPHTVRVKPGDRVTIELLATDVVHGLSLDGHDLDLVSDPGQPSTGVFTAGQAGVYRFRCSVTCGNLHPFMIGKLQVGSNQAFYRAAALSLLAAAAGYMGLRLR